MPTPGQQSLSNFYASVKFSHPMTAALMHADILSVGIFALAQDKTPANEAAENLRRRAEDLPEIHRRVLENALTELGF
jgi:hypothetical protein